MGKLSGPELCASQENARQQKVSLEVRLIMTLHGSMFVAHIVSDSANRLGTEIKSDIWPAINPRGSGAGYLPPTPKFLQMLKKKHLFLAHLFIHLFYTCCENFRPRSLKVRLPGHVVTSPQKKFEYSS